LFGSRKGETVLKPATLTMTVGRELSIQKKQEFWAQLFGVMMRYEQRINAAQRIDQELTSAANRQNDI
jgi:hypothetical protein